MSISSMTLDESAILNGNPPAVAVASATQPMVQIHPLAIVNMADQFTRISLGGSPLAPTEPVVGLLFGVRSSSSSSSTLTPLVCVADAEDVPINRSDAASTQISLHQAVYEGHTVVGWYRASDKDDAPTMDDVRTSMELAKHYSCGTATTSSSEKTVNSDSNGAAPFLFALLQVSHGDNGKADSNMDDSDGELPFTVFRVDTTDNVLIGYEKDSWLLETSNAERVAVERVMRERPPPQSESSSDETNEDSTKSTSLPSITTPATPFVHAITPVQQSVTAIDERLSVMQKFLVATSQGEIPFDSDLVRQVRGLLLHASVMNTSAPSDGPVADLLQGTAALAKTVGLVQLYTDKFKTVHNQTNPSGGSHHGGGMFAFH